MEEPRHPVGGIDYPITFQEFDEWFSSDDACLDYIAKLRWAGGFSCPSCGNLTKKPSLTGRGLFFAENVNDKLLLLLEPCDLATK